MTKLSRRNWTKRPRIREQMGSKKKGENKAGFVTKISSCQVNTTSRRGIKLLGISFGSIFLLFSYESSRKPHS